MASWRCTTRRRRLRARYATSSTLAQGGPSGRIRVSAGSTFPAPAPLPPAASPPAAALAPPLTGAVGRGPTLGFAGPRKRTCGCGLMLRAVELEPIAGAQARSCRAGACASARGGGGGHCASRPASNACRIQVRLHGFLCRILGLPYAGACMSAAGGSAGHRARRPAKGKKGLE